MKHDWKKFLLALAVFLLGYFTFNPWPFGGS